MHYLDLMAGQKPHLLVKSKNNLGSETTVEYAPSTKFYLQDKQDDKPWITKLPFPVHVVERTQTYDAISQNRFVTRYAYHHGYFDGVEREFRGFGMVEQWDTEEFAALTADGTLPQANNIDENSHIPPVHTKTWFHTGVYLGRNRVSDYFAGLLNATDIGEYYRQPGLTDEAARASLLDDTPLPDGLSVEEEREACRSLKGAMLRQEIYAEDGTDKAQQPYTIVEQNFTVKRIQPKATNRHAVFFSHAREAITYHLERNPNDPRIGHALTLAVDDYGNVLKSLAIGYGLAQSPLEEQRDRDKQTTTLITYTQNHFTNPVLEDDAYRTPLPAEALTYELIGFKPAQPNQNSSRFTFTEWTDPSNDLIANAQTINYEVAAGQITPQKRLIEHVRSLYRRNDLSGALPLGQVESLALPYESYKLAFTPGLLTQVYQRPLDNVTLTGTPQENLLTNPATILALNNDHTDKGGYVDLDNNGHWWLPTGHIFFSPNTADTPAQELQHARAHFSMPLS